MKMSLQISNLTKMKDISQDLAAETDDPVKCKRNYKLKKLDSSTSNVCKICGQVFVRRRNLTLHIQKHNGKKPFECHICQKKFPRSDHLKNHVGRHFKIGEHPCDQCDKIFKRADLLKYHKVNEHGSTISFNEIRSYTKASTSTQERNSQCGVCGKFFLDEKGLKAHSKIHLISPKHKCNHCGKLFNQRSNLTVHVRQHTGTKPYKCESCGETFSTSCKLKTHMRKHTGVLPFVCDVCGKQFGESHLLKMHMRIHDDFRAYVCSYCGKSFTHSSTLRSHVRIHTGAKPYKCDLCQESFAQISSLSYHKKSHMGEKPFVCDICGNRYTRRATLNAHQARHTGEKRFMCSHCDFKCDIANQLRKHMLLHHITKNVPIASPSNASQNERGVQPVEKDTANDHEKKSSSEAVIMTFDVSRETFSTLTGHANILSNRHQDCSENISLHAITSKTLSRSTEGIMCNDVNSPHSYGSDRHTVLSPQALCSDVTLLPQPTISYAMTSMEGSMKNGEPSTFPSDSIVLPLTTPKKSASELLHSQAQTHFPYHGSPPISLVHPTLPAKRVGDVENSPSHPDFQLENTSQLCDVSCSKTHVLTSNVQVSVNVSEPSSSAFSLLHSKPNLHSSPSLLPQACTSSLEESNHHFKGIAENKEKTCEVVSHTNENNLTLDPSQNDGQSKLSSNSNLKSLKQEMGDKQECHLGNRASLVVSPRPVQDISCDVRKEFLCESNSTTVNKHFASILPLHSSALNKETTTSSRKEVTLQPDKDDCKPINNFLQVLSPSQEDSISMNRQTCPTLEDLQLISEESRKVKVRTKDFKLASLFAFPSSSTETECSIKIELSEDCTNILNQTSAKYPHKRKQNVPSHKPGPKSRDRRKTQRQKESKDVHGVRQNLSQEESKMVITYKCEICGKTFARRNNWNIHMQLHRGEKSFKCPVCGKEFSRPHHMKDHLLLHSRAKELRCYHCLDEFSDQEQLEEHILKAHNSAYPFKCNVCSFSCLELIQLKGHISQTHAEINFSCQVCGLAFKTSIALKDHMKEHPGKNAFDCQQCGKSFLQNSCLILHIRKKHSGEKLFACGVCPDAFITASDLQRHLKGHTGDRPFACDQCKKLFADGKLLRRHKKIHLDERPYQCDHCPQRFKHRNTLCAHIRIHTGSKPYKCDVCGEAFTQLSSLAYHQQTHDRKKMYTCHICGKSYTRMATLNLHLLQHTGHSRFQCQKCAYKCNRSTNFKRHMEKCHELETTTE